MTTTEIDWSALEELETEQDKRIFKQYEEANMKVMEAKAQKFLKTLDHKKIEVTTDYVVKFEEGLEKLLETGKKEDETKYVRGCHVYNALLNRLGGK